MESLLAAWLQPFLLSLICAISGFSAWQLKRWMERIEREHGHFHERIGELDKFAATARDEQERKTAALARLFHSIEECGRRVDEQERDNSQRDQRITVVEKRVDYLERDLAGASRQIM